MIVFDVLLNRMDNIWPSVCVCVCLCVCVCVCTRASLSLSLSLSLKIGLFFQQFDELIVFQPRNGFGPKTLGADGFQAFRLSLHGTALPNHRLLNLNRCRVVIGQNKNKYRGGTSDATTPSSLIMLLIMMLLTTFYPQKRPYSSFENNTG